MTHHEIYPNTLYGCPGSVTIDGRVKTNYDSEVLGDINLENALGYSCDTYFYVPAANEYYADQNRIAHHQKPHEWLQRMAASFGVGTIAARRPAGQRAGRRVVRRPRDPPGAVEGEQGRRTAPQRAVATRTSRT